MSVSDTRHDIDAYGDVKHTKHTIKIDLELPIVKFNKGMAFKRYQKQTGKELRLGDVVNDMGLHYGHHEWGGNCIVVGWTKDEITVLPLEPGYGGHNWIVEGASSEIEIIWGHIGLKRLFDTLAIKTQQLFSESSK
jgi:hypothetical protein